MAGYDPLKAGFEHVFGCVDPVSAPSRDPLVCETSRTHVIASVCLCAKRSVWAEEERQGGDGDTDADVRASITCDTDHAVVL